MRYLVSGYKNGKSNQGLGNLDFLQWSIDPKHKVNVLSVRKGLGKKLYLECVLPAGIFMDRGLYSCIKPSGLLYVDIDHKSGTDMVHARKTLARDPCVLMVQASTGGKGLCVVYRIAPVGKEKYSWYYMQVEQTLAKKGIVVDRACKNINRVKFASYDPDTYINEKAKVLKLTFKPPKIKPVEIKIDSQLKKDIMGMIGLLEEGKVDITGSYNDWLYLAGMFNLIFGPVQGLKVFLTVSRFYPNYNEEEACSKFEYCKTFKDASPIKFFKLLSSKPVKK